MPYKDKAQQAEYQRNWMQKRRREFFAGKTCKQCGSTEDLELDHVDRKSKESHAIWSWSKARREAELAKCQVLCQDCHKKKTREDQKVIHPCGTMNSYCSGCRCNECKAGWATYMRNWRTCLSSSTG